MTENTTTAGDSESAETEIVALHQEEAEPALPEELIEIDDDGADEEDVPGTGAVSGGFGFAGLALGLVSLTTNWTASIISTRTLYNDQVNSKATTQAQANSDYVNAAAQGWHTQGWWALAFALGGLLFGAGALLSPSLLLSGKTPGWAKAASVAAIILGVIGAVLALLVITKVWPAGITVSTS